MTTGSTDKWNCESHTEHKARFCDDPMNYLLHLDGKMPNLALMRLSTYFKNHGEGVCLVRGDRVKQGRGLFDPPGFVYGSSIFEFSGPTRAAAEAAWGAVHWGGTGVRVESSLDEVRAGISWDTVEPDYSL